MSLPTPVPLYPTYDALKDIQLNEYPSLSSFLNTMDDQLWRLQHWQWGLEFLQYIGRNKSEHTYNRFRSETERFLLWLFLVKNQPMDGLKKSDILEYGVN